MLIKPFIKVFFNCLTDERLKGKHQLILFWCLLINLTSKDDSYISFDLKELSSICHVTESAIKKMRWQLIKKGIIVKVSNGRYFVGHIGNGQYMRMSKEVFTDETLTASEKIIKSFLFGFCQRYDEIKLKTLARKLGMSYKTVRVICNKLLKDEK